jgi:hypothetical protein
MRQKLSASKVEALYRRAQSSSATNDGGLYFRKGRKSPSWVISGSRDKLVSYSTIGRYPEVRIEQRSFCIFGYTPTSLSPLLKVA